jgi:hypothetical protein
MNATKPRASLAAVVAVALVLVTGGASAAAELYETYYRFLNDYPSCAETVYSEEVQGITHDNLAWYISQNWADWGTGVVYRIEVADDLASPPWNVPYSDEISGDLGSLSYYEYPAASGAGYLIVPVDHDTSSPSLAILHADTEMDLVGYVPLAGQTDAEWVAVSPSGVVFTSEWGYISEMIAYTLDWSQLPAHAPTITSTTHIPLLDSEGNPGHVDKVQGGVVSPGEGLLYLSTGDREDFEETDPYRDIWGIYVFDMDTWREVARSTNGSGLFNYQFDPKWTVAQQPQGLTIWDLDSGIAPNVSGQFHVLMLENDLTSPDDVYIKHYTNVVHVDAGFVGSEDGTVNKPYNTVQEALAFYGNYDFWNGGKIRIKAGTYPEVVTFGKRMQVLARVGAATVGTFGQVRLDTPGAININSGAAVKLH